MVLFCTYPSVFFFCLFIFTAVYSISLNKYTPIHLFILQLLDIYVVSGVLLSKQYYNNYFT